MGAIIMSSIPYNIKESVHPNDKKTFLTYLHYLALQTVDHLFVQVLTPPKILHTVADKGKRGAT